MQTALEELKGKLTSAQVLSCPVVTHFSHVGRATELPDAEVRERSINASLKQISGEAHINSRRIVYSYFIRSIYS